LTVGFALAVSKSGP